MHFKPTLFWGELSRPRSLQTFTLCQYRKNKILFYLFKGLKMVIISNIQLNTKSFMKEKITFLPSPSYFPCIKKLNYNKCISQVSLCKHTSYTLASYAISPSFSFFHNKIPQRSRSLWVCKQCQHGSDFSFLQTTQEGIHF